MMGSVYRKTATKPLPAGAELFTRNGERFARWKSAKGKTRTASVTVGRDGSDRIVVTVGTFIAKYRNGDGHVTETATGCREEASARSVLAKLERRAELVKAEVMTKSEAATAEHQQTPLADHFAAFHEYRTAKGLNAVRIANTKARLTLLARECGFSRLSDLSADALTRWLAIQQAKQPKGMSAGNRNEYRQELVGFGNWCVETDRLTVNPFSMVPKADAKSGRRRQRRAMNEGELVKLLQVAKLRPLAEYGRASVPVDEKDLEANDQTPKRSNWTKALLTLDGLKAAVERSRKRLAKNPEFVAKLERIGRERALIYKTLLLTGLRKNELASLTVGQLQLEGPMPFVELEAADEKNREGSTIPLRADLAADLKEWLSDAPTPATLRLRSAKGANDGKRRLFKVPAGLVRILNRDLTAADIKKADERGRTIDVHSLRHSFGTLLSKGGVAPRTAQSAMRHSTIDLTMNVYTDPKLLDIHGALDALPLLDLNAERTAERAAARATGTDHQNAGPVQDNPSPKFAPAFAPEFARPGAQASQLRSITVHEARDGDMQSSRRERDKTPTKQSEKALPTVFASKAFSVERKGVEPSTSALRTQRSPN